MITLHLFPFLVTTIYCVLSKRGEDLREKAFMQCALHLEKNCLLGGGKATQRPLVFVGRSIFMVCILIEHKNAPPKKTDCCSCYAWLVKNAICLWKLALLLLKIRNLTFCYVVA